MYRRILAPVDGSVAAGQGLQEAIKLALAGNATLYLIHIVNEFLLDPVYVPSALRESLFESFRISGQGVLARAQAAARQAGVAYEGDLIETIGGNVSQLILEAARARGADLIVMGTHGRRGMRRLTLGSDAEAVLRSSTLPVLLVRERSQRAE